MKLHVAQKQTTLPNHSHTKDITKTIIPETINSMEYADKMKANFDNPQTKMKEERINQKIKEKYSETITYHAETRHNEAVQCIVEKYVGGLTRIYIDLFGEQTLEEILNDINATQGFQKDRQQAKDQILTQAITNEIVRLQQVEADYATFNKMLQKSAKKGSNEQKWKIIVLNYREKLLKYQANLKDQKRMKVLLQKQLNARIQEISRLSNMNNIKFQKLNATINELNVKQTQTKQLNTKLIEMELDLSSLKVNAEKVQQTLQAVERQKESLTQQLMQISQSFKAVSHELQIERERSLLLQREKEQLCLLPQPKMLSIEDEDIKRQISDIKSKYEYEKIQLQLKLNNTYIQKQQLQLKLLELEQKIHLIQQQKSTEEVSTQTEQNVVKAVFYNSLQDQLQDEDLEETQHQNNFSNGSNEQSDCEFELSLDPRSINNHQINTPRQFYQSYSDKEKAENHYCSANIDASFQQGNSMSNAPSRYMDTLQQLTAELAQAYQKINELTQRINMLQEQNKNLRAKAVQIEKQGTKLGGGIFNNFFKK